MKTKLQKLTEYIHSQNHPDGIPLEFGTRVKRKSATRLKDNVYTFLSYGIYGHDERKCYLLSDGGSPAGSYLTSELEIIGKPITLREILLAMGQYEDIELVFNIVDTKKVLLNIYHDGVGAIDLDLTLSPQDYTEPTLDALLELMGIEI